MMNKFEYSKKINYLMCKWLVPPRKNHNEMNLRNAFYNMKRATTKDEMRILVFKSAFYFLIKNDLSKAIKCLEAFYYIDLEEANNLSIQLNKKNPDFDLLAYVLVKQSLPVPYLVLFYNSLRVKNEVTPIIFRKDQIDRMTVLIKKNEFTKAKGIFQLCLDNSEKHLMTNSLISRQKIMDRINNVRNELKSYDVQEILIYGSFARDEATKFSDLDMVIITNKKKMSDDYIFALQKFIEGTLEVQLDLHLFSGSIDYSIFDKKMLEDMTSIIKI